ncbi:hypothetical protein [Streptomyces eurythermus]|uniref:hypothetical protein n=1 Tax=Streptomyces eurythermus TaxID=42237 RepID=UPI0036F89143
MKEDEDGVPGSRPGGEPKAKAPARSEVNFPPVLNGIDYLDNVADHLRFGQPTPRNLKYAVLHLQAAAEVLLKARLVQEHWSLVFKDPGIAKRDRFEAGDFDSCTTTGAIGRLRDIASVPIGDKPAKSLAVLAKWRNRLQHYGLKAPGPAVEVCAAQVLDFLVTFVHDELLPALPGQDSAAVADDLESVGMKVRGIRSYMDTRLKRLAEELKGVQGRTVMCPVCEQWAMVIGGGTSPLDCRFCHTTWAGPSEALTDYFDAFAWRDGNVQECPDCHQHTLLVDGAGTALAPEEHLTLCFCCGTEFSAIAQCSDCLNTYVATGDDDLGMCGDCADTRYAKF